MSLDVLLSRLEGVKKTGDDGKYKACCPSHNDRTPSLRIREMDDGRILLHCFAGCGIEEILAAVNISFAHLFPPQPLQSHSYSPVRRPFVTGDILRAIGFEVLLVAVAACNIAKGITLTTEDLERLILASGRIQTAISESGHD